MKKQLAILFPITFIIFACKTGPQKFAENPNKLLDHSKMVKIMADIQIAEGALSIKKFHKDSSDFYARGYYHEVLEHHNVTVEKYKRTAKYYFQNPDAMKELYNPVIERLGTKEGRDWNRQ